MIKRFVAWLIGLILVGPLIAACSFGAEPAATGPTQPKTSAARPVVQSSITIAGRLLFVQDGDLYVQQGNSAKQLTADGKTRDPAWSPDAKRIAFVRREESFSDLYILDANGGIPTQVTFNRGRSDPWTQTFMHEVVWAAEPAWTPDGQHLLFLSQVAPPQENPVVEYPLSIYRYALSLIGKRQPTNDDLLIRSDDADLQHPAWAPDGSALAYVRVPRGDEPKQVMRYDPATQTTETFPGIPADSYDPAWSPDGRWLAFVAVIDGKHDIWAIPAVGGTAVQLTQSGTARAPAWSPDGSQLAFVQVGATGSDIYILPIKHEGDALTADKATQLTSSGQIDANSGLSWSK